MPRARKKTASAMPMTSSGHDRRQQAAGEQRTCARGACSFTRPKAKAPPSPIATTAVTTARMTLLRERRRHQRVGERARVPVER